jgi:hypothetical protein
MLNILGTLKGRPFRRKICRWDDSIVVDLKEMQHKNADHTAQFYAFVNKTIKLWIS